MQLDVTEALGQLVTLVTDLAQAGHLASLREVERRHILLVLAQASQALEEANPPNDWPEEAYEGSVQA
jgi:hypothetical protein